MNNQQDSNQHGDPQINHNMFHKGKTSAAQVRQQVGRTVQEDNREAICPIQHNKMILAISKNINKIQINNTWCLLQHKLVMILVIIRDTKK
jgi:hypothetical protein